MKAARIILLFVCFFILKGYNHAFASTFTHTARAFPVQIIEYKNPLTWHCSHDKDIWVAYIECEEEETGNDAAPGRKKIPVSRFFTSGTALTGSAPGALPGRQRSPDRPYHVPGDRYLLHCILRV